MSTSSGKDLKSCEGGHIVCLRSISLASASSNKDTFSGFARQIPEHARESTTNKTKPGNIQKENLLQQIFGSAEHQYEALNGFCYEMKTKTINSNNTAFLSIAATVNGEVVMKGVSWYIPHCAPSENQKDVVKEFVTRHPTEMCYIKRLVFQRPVQQQKNRISNLERELEITYVFK